MCGRSICYCHCCCHAGCLSGTNALRDQCQPVNCYVISGNMSTWCQEVFHLLWENCTIRNLYRTAVIDLTDRGMPSDDIILLWCECKVFHGHDVFAFQTTAAAGSQLRSDIIKICITECYRHSLFQICQHIAHGISGLDFCLCLICNYRAVFICMPVIDPALIILICWQRHSTEAGDPGYILTDHIGSIRTQTFPFFETIPVDAADTPYQSSRIASCLAVSQCCKRSTCLIEDITISGRIDHDLCFDQFTAFLAFKNDAGDCITFHNRTYTKCMINYPDRIFFFQKHFIHFNLQLVWLKIDRTDQAARLATIKASAADTVMNGRPGIDQQRVCRTDLIPTRSSYCIWNLFQTLEPLLLQTTDELHIIPAQVRDHNDITARYITAAISIAFHQDNILAASACGSDSCGMSGRSSADYQYVTCVIDRNISGLFSIHFSHDSFSFLSIC